MFMLSVYFLQAYGEGMIQPESIDGVSSMPDDMSTVYQPVDFCIPIGPIFNFVSGTHQFTTPRVTFSLLL